VLDGWVLGSDWVLGGWGSELSGGCVWVKRGLGKGSVEVVLVGASAAVSVCLWDSAISEQCSPSLDLLSFFLWHGGEGLYGGLLLLDL
jgi:hypothetical protein